MMRGSDLEVVTRNNDFLRCTMFEPHLTNHFHHNHDDDKSILDELDKIAPLKSFDAFPKVQPTYTSTSRRGGVLTAVVGLIIFLLVVVGFPVRLG